MPPIHISLFGSWIHATDRGRGILHFPESVEAVVHELLVFPLPLVAIYDSEEAAFPKPEPIAPSSMLLLVSVSKNILKFLAEKHREVLGIAWPRSPPFRIMLPPP